MATPMAMAAVRIPREDVTAPRSPARVRQGTTTPAHGRPRHHRHHPPISRPSPHPARASLPARATAPPPRPQRGGATGPLPKYLPSAAATGALPSRRPIRRAVLPGGSPACPPHPCQPAPPRTSKRYDRRVEIWRGHRMGARSRRARHAPYSSRRRSERTPPSPNDCVHPTCLVPLRASLLLARYLCMCTALRTPSFVVWSNRLSFEALRGELEVLFMSYTGLSVCVSP